MQPLKPALQYSQGRSFNWSGAVLTNCFAEKADGDRTADFAVLATPGLTTAYNVGTGPYRGSIVCNGVLYMVSGNGLYSVGENITYLGAIVGTGPVSIAANYTDVCIAAGGVGYVWHAGALSSPVPFAVSRVVFADGYMVWVVQDSQQFCISALDNAMSYDPADVAQVEGSPGNIVGMVWDHRELQFYCEKTTEIFYNSGAAFPFSRQGNAFIERGCFDGDSCVKMDSSVYFMGNDRVIYMLNGYTPQRISTHVIEYYLRDTTYARGFTYSQEGHKFFCLEVNRGTFLFDVATGAWHRRASYGSEWWRCFGAVDAYGQTLLGDRTAGALYVPSPDVNDEAGNVIAMDITLPTLEYGRERVTMYAFEVTCETGTAAKVMLTYSDDGGHTWSNEMWRDGGRVGEYHGRYIWRKLGRFRVRQMRLRITDAARRIVIAYWADIQ
jgi:hypothetical protein